MIEILDSKRFGSISAERLGEFEAKYSLKLPDDYRTFLLDHNGGKPKPNINKNPETDIQWIYGIHHAEYWASLEEHIATYENRIPSKTVPIANDSLGNLFLLSLREETYGEIWFWDHENESDTSGKEYYDNIEVSASSFKDFLTNLYEWIDEKETEIDRILRTNDLNALNELLDSGYKLNSLDEYNRSLIENAVIKNRFDIVKLAVQKGADLRNSIALAEQNHKFFPTAGFDSIIDYLNNRKKKNGSFGRSEFVKMNFRKATRSDVAEIVEMIADDELGQTRENFQDPLPVAYLDAFNNIDADPNQELVVVEDAESGIIGTLQLSFIQYLTYQGGIRAQIEAVRIRKDKRGLGIGKEMFEWAIGRAKERKAHVLQLTTDKRRPEAIKFYEDLGFVSSHEGMKMHIEQ